MRVKIVRENAGLLDSSMLEKINEMERSKNIQLIEKAQEKLKAGVDVREVLWPGGKNFASFHDEIIKNFKDSQFILDNKISSPPTNREFVEAIAAEIGRYMMEETYLIWEMIPTVKGREAKEFLRDSNNLIKSLLTNPELCNISASRIAMDEKKRIVLLEKGEVVNPAEKVEEAVKKYYERNLNGVKIPIGDLLAIRDTILTAWEFQFSADKEPSKFKRNI
jgi:hypothetical protein